MRGVCPACANPQTRPARHYTGVTANHGPRCAAHNPTNVEHTSEVAGSTAEPVTIGVSDTHRVSGLLLRPADAAACVVLAHGAGAGMQHPFMTAVAAELYALGIATLRYQFPYMERRSRRPDPPALCHATVRAATAEAARLAPRLATFRGWQILRWANDIAGASSFCACGSPRPRVLRISTASARKTFGTASRAPFTGADPDAVSAG